MRRRENAGLTALMDVARLGGPPEPWHLGFLLGPRINAGGRIGRAALGVELLLHGRSDRMRAHRRRARPPQPRAPGDRSGDAGAGRGRGAWPRSASRRRARSVVTAAEGWHPGVVGLVAARLKERFGRPAFAIALEPGGIGTGSGRSIAGVDLGRAVRAGGGRGAADQGRRPCHGGGRHAAQGRAGAVPRLSRKRRSALPLRRRGATMRS